MTQDHYAWWRAALAKQPTPIHDGQPQCGFYSRKMAKSGPAVAAAIWSDAGNLACRIGNEMVDAVESWSFLAANPVEEAAARHWFEYGRWPNEDRIVEQPSNLPSDPAEACLLLIDAELEAARDWIRARNGVGINTKELANAAGDRIGTLRELVSRAKKLHKTEKDPHLTAGRAVDLRYNPKIEKLDLAIKKFRDMAEAYLKVEETKQREAIRAAEAARAEAEAVAKAKADKAAAAGRKPPAAVATLPEVPEFEKIKIGGNTGKAIGLRSGTVTIITDYPAALAHFSNDIEVVELINKLARQALKAGHIVPGASARIEEIAA